MPVEVSTLSFASPVGAISVDRRGIGDVTKTVHTGWVGPSGGRRGNRRGTSVVSIALADPPLLSEGFHPKDVLMSELRRDPVIGRWVIVAVERANRPQAQAAPDKPSSPGICPFCPGNEHMTPPEVLAFRPPDTLKDGPGWWLRCVTNKFPALMSDGEAVRRGDGMYDRIAGVGAHEVVIETPKHDSSPADLEPHEVQEILWAYRDRTVALSRDPRFRYVMIFKNQGRQAGATLDHPHSQIIALPIVPKRVQEEINGSKTYYDYKERCVFCDMIEQERKSWSRVVEINDDFISFCPFASRFPFETWIVPRVHATHFRDAQKSDIVSLAQILRDTLKRIKAVLKDPHYNYVIHTTPSDQGHLPHYHWHIEIIPKLTQVAGFEWGTGFYINPTPPEVAAEFLREVELGPVAPAGPSGSKSQSPALDGLPANARESAEMKAGS